MPTPYPAGAIGVTRKAKASPATDLGATQNWVPHLRDGLIVAKVGIRAPREPHSSTPPNRKP
jgi:hypothetical protein